MMHETWKAVEGFPGYEVSDHGRVRSFWRRWGLGRGHGGKFVLTDRPLRILIPTTHPGGALQVKPRRDNKNHPLKVHRLVLEAFVGPCPSGHECRHLDGNPTNNHLGNLCWSTHADNMADTLRHGTHNRGERHGCSRLTESQVKNIRELHTQGSINPKVIGEMFGIARSYVYQIVHRARWKHLT